MQRGGLSAKQFCPSRCTRNSLTRELTCRMTIWVTTLRNGWQIVWLTASCQIPAPASNWLQIFPSNLMTCIVALKTEKGVMLGADSCVGAEHRAVGKIEPKVKKVGEYLIGTAGSVRAGQVIKHCLSTKKFNEKDDFYWHVLNVLVPEIRKAIKDAGAMSIEHSLESINSHLIIAHKNRVIVLQGDLGVIEYEDDFISIGCGEEWATGAMFAVAPSDIKPKQILTLGLDAACRYSSYVRPPYHFIDNFGDSSV